MGWSDPAVVDILDRAMVARIATMSRSGRPHVNPLYFVVAGDHLHLGTATYTLAAKNVEANPAVQILLEVESDPEDRTILRVTGTAVVRTDAPTLARYRRVVARKYVVTPRGLWNMLVHPRQWRPMRKHLSGGEACVLDVTLESVELLAPGGR